MYEVTNRTGSFSLYGFPICHSSNEHIWLVYVFVWDRTYYGRWKSMNLVAPQTVSHFHVQLCLFWQKSPVHNISWAICEVHSLLSYFEQETWESASPTKWDEMYPWTHKICVTVLFVWPIRLILPDRRTQFTCSSITRRYHAAHSVYLSNRM